MTVHTAARPRTLLWLAALLLAGLLPGTVALHPGEARAATGAGPAGVKALGAADRPPAPTEDLLASLILTPDEIGLGFSVAEQGPLDALFANYRVLYQRQTAPAAIAAAWLVDVRAGSADQAVQSFVDGFVTTVNGTSAPAAAPVLGQDTVRYTLAAQIGEQNLTGEVLVWRENTVLALVAVLSTGDLPALDAATILDARLRETFGPLSEPGEGSRDSTPLRALSQGVK